MEQLGLISYFGTGLAVVETTLEDGTCVVLRRDPSTMRWSAYVPINAVGNFPVVLSFPHVRFEDRMFVVDQLGEEGPQDVLRRLQTIVAASHLSTQVSLDG